MARCGHSAGDKRAASGRDGFILVAVLAMLALLAALVGAFAVYGANTAVSVRVGEGRLRTNALVTSALELTAYNLTGTDDETRPSSGVFTFQLSHANVSVVFRTEGARVDLNFASKDLLTGLFMTLGAKDEDAAFAAERVIGWRKKNETPGQNAEAERYATAGLKYAPRQAPFQNVAELNFVLGLSPALVERARPFITVFNGRAGIDANEAAPEVINSLPRMTPSLAAAILQRRDPKNPRAIANLLGAAGDSVQIGGRTPVRATVHITNDVGRAVNAEAVIMVMDTGLEPYRVLAWQDDYDGGFGMR